MAEMTKIQRCDHTFNPWMGCAKVSPGCANCYAEMSTPSRSFGIKWGKGQPRQRTSASNWKEPLRWNRQAAGGDGKRPRVFCASLADWLDDEVPIEWLADLLKLIHDTPNLDWLLLTKRPENWYRRVSLVDGEMAESWIDCIDMPERGTIPENVWIGTTTEDQQRADERIPELLKIPARVRFLSVEPILGFVDFGLWLKAKFGRLDENFQEVVKPAQQLHWVIVGGESGSKARPCNVDWIRITVRQCRSAGVACFVKQLGANIIMDGPFGEDRELHEIQLSTKHPKGGDVDEWPEDLRVREFPAVQQKATKGAKG